MQKKLIALAVAGLLSVPAFAQSNVTLYGSIDYGYTMLGSNVKGVKARNALDSGISRHNRIGIKGTEDLGNGLKAVFVLENGLLGDTQGSNGMFNGTNRQSYAGLAGEFGTVAWGRQYTPQHLFTSAVDPFAKQGIGGAGNVLFQDRRLQNLTAYISPDFSGFNVIVGYTFNGLGQEAIENNRDARVWAIAPSFKWNKLFVAGNYHNVKLNRNNATKLKGESAIAVYDLYASYDFDIAKVGATIGQRKTKKAVAGTQKDSKITQFMLGATFKLTPNDSILASYARASENKVFDGTPRVRIAQWALGYEHALSKRTALYAQFAMQNHNKAFKDNVPFHTTGDVGAPGSVGASSLDGDATGKYRRGFTFGMRHDF